MRQMQFRHDENTLTAYLNDLKRIPLMNEKEEYACACAAYAGDAQAKNALVRANVRFVISVARHYRTCGLPLADLISEGNIGLLTAAERFNPARGCRFISYAACWIRQSILKALNEKARIIRFPVSRIRAAKSTYEYIPPVTSVNVGISKTQGGNRYGKRRATMCRAVPTVEEVHIWHTPLSLDAPLGASGSRGESGDVDGLRIGDCVPDDLYAQPEEHMLACALQADIAKILRLLPARDAQVIRYRFGLGGYERRSLQEIGEIFQITKERVRQIEKKALLRIRSCARQHRLDSYIA